jgi:hypothetical protein
MSCFLTTATAGAGVAALTWGAVSAGVAATTGAATVTGVGAGAVVSSENAGAQNAAATMPASIVLLNEFIIIDLISPAVFR